MQQPLRGGLRLAPRPRDQGLSKGRGRINGGGDYGFLLTAIDGQLNGQGGTERFRIKIWDRATDLVLYDDQLGGDEFGDAATGSRRRAHRDPEGCAGTRLGDGPRAAADERWVYGRSWSAALAFSSSFFAPIRSKRCTAWDRCSLALSRFPLSFHIRPNSCCVLPSSNGFPT